MNFIFDIDNTITGYGRTFVAKAQAGRSPLLEEVVRLGTLQGVDREDGWRRVLAYTENHMRWDFGELFRLLGIPFEEGDAAMEEVHRAYFDVYPDTVTLIRLLAERGIAMYVASNNPLRGCRWKLQRAGLDPQLFHGIFSTDFTGSCKGVPGVWEFIAARLDTAPESFFMVGDDFREDGELPIQAGLGGAYILQRDPHKNDSSDLPNLRFVSEATQILEYLK